jgi:hypothetical protein
MMPLQNIVAMTAMALNTLNTGFWASPLIE